MAIASLCNADTQEYIKWHQASMKDMKQSACAVWEASGMRSRLQWHMISSVFTKYDDALMLVAHYKNACKFWLGVVSCHTLIYPCT